MKMTQDLSAIESFLLCPTPQSWVDSALQNLDILLIDHANCEAKAAQTAQAIMWKYGVGRGNPQTEKSGLDRHVLLNKLSRLAREELRHFEQVIGIMKQRGIAYTQLTAADYAAGMRGGVRSQEPGRLVDTLVVGAIIEARSCERFARLVPVLDDQLATFYASLLKSEARHFKDYLDLASGISSKEDVAERLPGLLQRERELIEGVSAEFRFHSGVPAA